MIQIEAMRDKIGALKKDIKENYGIPVATITKGCNYSEKRKSQRRGRKVGRDKRFCRSLFIKFKFLLTLT